MKKQSRRLQAGKKNRKVSCLVHNLCPWTTCACESNNDCCITCMCFHVITETSDRPCTQHQGLRILVGITRASQECGESWEKSRYTVNAVSLTKNSLQAPLVALNYSVEYFHGTYWTYWPVSGVQMSGEWREWRAERNNKRAGIEKKKAACQLRNGVYIFTISVFDLSSLTRS